MPAATISGSFSPPCYACGTTVLTSRRQRHHTRRTRQVLWRTLAAAATALYGGSAGHVEQRLDAAALEPAGHDQPLDLAGALPDAVDPQLAQEPLGCVRPHVAAAAERLHRPVGAAVCRLAGEQLGRAGPVVHQLAVGGWVVGHAGDVVDQQPRRQAVRRRVGQREADALEVEDAGAELLA